MNYFNPLVVETQYKFYAGAPLLNKMDLSWDLCVIDTKPNKLNEEQKCFTTLANQVVALNARKFKNLQKKSCKISLIF
jgi:hypothetical protein